MTNKLTNLMLMAAIALLLAGCSGSTDSGDVPSLQDTQPTANETSPDLVGDPINDNETLMMAFTECQREQGIDVVDPVVDAQGNIGKPEFASDVDVKGDDFGEAYETCAEHLEGLSFGKERVDTSEQVDQFVALASCLRDRGYDVADPTAETLDQWGLDFKNSIDLDDPTAVSVYEECSGETVADGSGK